MRHIVNFGLICYCLHSARPLTVWEVELYAFVREQNQRNEERAETSRRQSMVSSDELHSDTDTNTDTSDDDSGRHHQHSHNKGPAPINSSVKVASFRKSKREQDEEEENAKVRSMLEPFWKEASNSTTPSNTAAVSTAATAAAAGCESKPSNVSSKKPLSWDNISLPSSIDDDEIKSETDD
jgi:hypothetical protein